MVVRNSLLTIVLVFAALQLPQTVAQKPQNAFLEEEEEAEEKEYVLQSRTRVTIPKEMLFSKELVSLRGLLTLNEERFTAFNTQYPDLGMGEGSTTVDINITDVKQVDETLKISAIVDVMFTAKRGGIGIARNRGESWELKEGKLRMIKGDKWSGYMVL